MRKPALIAIRGRLAIGETLKPSPGKSVADTLNYMVQYQSIDRTLAALADPTRRGILERLGRRGTASVSELAEPAGMSLTGMKKHLGVLEDAGLVSTEKVGRTRHCSLGPKRLEDLQGWMDSYRAMVEERFDRLEELLKQTRGDAS
jgi:DNA-binding transcriptional ArsR family regulator